MPKVHFELRDAVDHPPFCCITCRSSAGPFVDLGREVAIEWLYLCLACAGEVAGAAHGLDAVGRGALVEALQTEREQVKALEAVVETQSAALEQAELLRRAVAFTLEHGAVYDAKLKKIKPRAIPGVKAPDFDEPLAVVEDRPPGS